MLSNLGLLAKEIKVAEIIEMDIKDQESWAESDESVYSLYSKSNTFWSNSEFLQCRSVAAADFAQMTTADFEDVVDERVEVDELVTFTPDLPTMSAQVVQEGKATRQAPTTQDPPMYLGHSYPIEFVVQVNAGSCDGDQDNFDSNFSRTSMTRRGENTENAAT
jgi:hypothetical protein